ncbi:MAG: pilus assembly protein TadG-related protein [Syntrophomonadaceae bacterium]|nr:pilus assembly protein TadG-related protein [Syntrophomonadaceae bacterium]
MRKLFSEEKGSVGIILLVLVLVFFTGMSVLVTQQGAVYLTKSRMQNAVDAAALAGAQDLAEDSTGVEARQTAALYLGKNGVNVPDDYSPSLDTKDTITEIPDTVILEVKDSMGLNYSKIFVSATREVPPGLAKIFGGATKDVTATAVVQIKPITGMNGLAPMGCLETECTFNGLEVTLKCNALTDIPTTNGTKWRGWIRLDDEQGAGYADVIEDGCITPVEIGEYWNTQTGVVNAKPIKDVIMDLVDGCTHDPKCTASSYVDGCPRIVYLPVVETDDSTGEAVFSGSKVKIAGFAAFILTDYYENQFIKGYFIRDVTGGEVSTGGGSDYGLYTGKLIQ